MIKLALQSDYRDFYDSAFDLKAPETYVLQRNSQADGFGRDALFNFLQASGWKTPRYGIVGTDDLFFAHKWVVYDNLWQHCGYGKRVTERIDEKADHGKLAAEFVGPVCGQTGRILQIGGRAFLLRYKSSTDWRSNVGDVEIGLIRELPRVGFNSVPHWPLQAVDFVTRSGDWMSLGSVEEYQQHPEVYAVDLNSAPGMRWTGIDKTLTADEVFEEIKAAYEHYLHR